MECTPPVPATDRIIIHFDYDCFYAAVVEKQQPSLQGKPLAIQQKQIIVTCNYEARRRGLHKLQLVKEARKLCPDLIIVLGEDLTQFRNASKQLYDFIHAFSWNQQVERLGLDEVFLDVSDVIEYNHNLLGHDLSQSFFHLDKNDPTQGWQFDASVFVGHIFPPSFGKNVQHMTSEFSQRLRLASHLAQHIRGKMEFDLAFTCTVGISTSKLLSKVVGNVNKPNAQTTLLPPYAASFDAQLQGAVSLLVDALEVRKLPGIGSKTARKIRGYIQQYSSPTEPLDGSEGVSVAQVKAVPGMGSAKLERLLANPGIPGGIGLFVWNTLHGVDNSQIGQAKDIPKQISIEDSYGRLDSISVVTSELTKLSQSLVTRMRVDLYRPSSPSPWLGRPRNLRLSTRLSRRALPSETPGNTGQYLQHYGRASRSAVAPTILFSATESVETIAARLVTDVWLPLFRMIHPNSGWVLNLLNVAAVNIEDPAHMGRNISGMFQNQEQRLGDWQKAISLEDTAARSVSGDETEHRSSDSTAADVDSIMEANTMHMVHAFEDQTVCSKCGMSMPSFAATAHQRFHDSGE